MGLHFHAKIVSIIIIIVYLKSISSISQNKIQNFTSNTRNLKKNLGFYEDTYLNFTELTFKYGYLTEEHQVTTEDGYILTLYRILHKCEISNQFPVLLFHGIFDSSDAWIVGGPKHGLGYILADKCYDVWTANHRGNTYSRKHVKLDPDNDVIFWDFSFDEHANFDAPAIIDHILKATNKSRINYIGHSQGTTVFFAMTALRPEYNKKIQLSIHLAPVVWLKNVKTPARLLSLKAQEIKEILDSAGFSELLARHQPFRTFIEFLCQFAPTPFCSAGLFVTTGYVDGVSPRMLAVGFGHLPSGTSSKSLAHYGQLVVSQKFRRYDEGRNNNIKRYKSVNPPEYNVSRTTSPVVLICGRNDWLSSLEDIDILISRLPNILEKYIVADNNWSHTNHLWGWNAPELEYFKILEYLKSFNT